VTLLSSHSRIPFFGIVFDYPRSYRRRAAPLPLFSSHSSLPPFFPPSASLYFGFNAFGGPPTSLFASLAFWSLPESPQDYGIAALCQINGSSNICSSEDSPRFARSCLFFFWRSLSLPATNRWCDLFFFFRWFLMSPPTKSLQPAVVFPGNPIFAIFLFSNLGRKKHPFLDSQRPAIFSFELPDPLRTPALHRKV